MVTVMIARSPELEPVREVLTGSMLEIVESGACADLEIRSYAAHLDQAELEALAQVFASPAYQKFRRRMPETPAASNAGFSALFQSCQADLSERIRAWQCANGR